MTLPSPRRAAYTLLELLVVIGLIVFLATLTVAVANSSLVDSYKVVGGADRLSGWLLQAKMRALRDRTPVGLRLIRGSANPLDPEYHVVRTAQIVEMPALYAPNQEPDSNLLPANAPTIVVHYSVATTGTGVSLLSQEHNANGDGVYLFWPTSGIQFPSFAGLGLLPGDLLRIPELNSMHRIQSATPLASVPSWMTVPGGMAVYKLILGVSNVRLETGLQFPPTPPYPTNLLPANANAVPAAGSTQAYPTGYPPIGAANYYRTHYFGLYRSSRPILGEPILQLPANMAVDVYQPATITTPGDRGPSQNIPTSTGGDLEVIFNPSGSVLFSNDGLIVFWLRNTANSNQTPLYVNSITGPNNDVYIDKNRLMLSGEHVLVTVYARTGGIATYQVYTPDDTGRYDGRPINVAGGDGGLAGPYRYALKAVNLGL